MPVEKFVLPNGVRVLVEPLSHLDSISIGLWCQTGSGDEQSHEAGLTHLIEHMLFKGTSRRSASEIAHAIEGRGGGLNAFTDKERTCYYCRMLAEDMAVGVDVLTDMMSNSLIDPAELEKEKQVVLEEIKRSEDEPGDEVHDQHVQRLWGNHALGLPIIGTKDSVSSFKQDHIRTYMNRRYNGANVMLAVAGRCDSAEVRDFAEKTLGSIPPGGSDRSYGPPTSTFAKEEIKKSVEQVHFCIGGDALAITDERMPILWVLDAVLGGGMGSRIFQEVREKRGLAYSVGSYFSGYSTGGFFSVYGGTGAETWQETQDVIHAELKKISDELVPSEEIDRVKTQLISSMVLGLETSSARMMRMSRNEFIHGRDVPISEVRAKVLAVTAEQVIELAKWMFEPSRLRTTAIVPSGK